MGLDITATIEACKQLALSSKIPEARTKYRYCNAALGVGYYWVWFMVWVVFIVLMSSCLCVCLTARMCIG